MAIDFAAIARQFQLEESQVRATIELLDEGNTVPFITRYRKDRTGGLDEEKIRLIEDAVTRRRQLEERKDRILRSIHSQGKLTEDLQRRIRQASSLKVLDDLYLPYRPKKQTLATAARKRGLEPIALEILNCSTDSPQADRPLSARLEGLIDPAKDLKSVSDVATGVRHILAEIMSERTDLRTLARKRLWNGELVSKRIEQSDQDSHGSSHDPSEDRKTAPSETLSGAEELTVSMAMDRSVRLHAPADTANQIPLGDLSTESEGSGTSHGTEGSAGVDAGSAQTAGTQTYSEDGTVIDISPASGDSEVDANAVGPVSNEALAEEIVVDSTAELPRPGSAGTIDTAEVDVSQVVDSESFGRPTDAAATDSVSSSPTLSSPDAVEADTIDIGPGTGATDTGDTDTDGTERSRENLTLSQTVTNTNTPNSTDAAVPDSSAVANAGSVDTGSVDTEPVDTGSVDTGPVDTGPVDTGPVVTGPVDPAPADIPSAPSADIDSVDTTSADTGSVGATNVDADQLGAVAIDTSAASPQRDASSASPSPSAKKQAKARGRAARSPAELAAEKQRAAEERRRQRREARHRKRQKLEQSFKDYFDYSEPIKKLPHYRVLAINRGERCKVLRVKIQHDPSQLRQEAEKLAVPEGHPYADLLTEALHDALSRLVVPSIEREVRRELTERAESHAVKVFAQNLRKLLLQAPLRNRRVLAIDPGFRSGCKLTALDEFGNVLGHSLIHVIGAAERVEQSRARLIEMIRNYQIMVVAIGNGTACRETEQLVAGVLTQELADTDVRYLIVNEAGASVYSTSQIGREELPRYDATVRGAVSIGRRALDPLSELVKIDPASIGVGLYQHDVKAKHLRTSLDAVVESCVNYVGVDVNSASPALLGYVSGLNQLTARRVYEYRQKHGPFRNREQLKKVSGVGEATYVQAAGFLKIVGGDNPLDATWIHPESYQIAEKVIDRLGCRLDDLVRLTSPFSTSAAATPSATADEPSSNTLASGADQPDAAPSVGEPVPSEGPSEATSEASGQPAAAMPSESESQSAESQKAESQSAESLGTGSTDAGPSGAGQHARQPADSTESARAGVSSSGTASTTLAERLTAVDAGKLADELGVGVLCLKDILAGLARPGRDPREDLRPPVFRREVLKLEDLKPGMELSGTVLNVVDFGAFVDIGLSDSGLIHISRLANRYVADPHEVVSVGDILNVWVVDVDEKRRRVSLTAIAPGTETETSGAAPRGKSRRGGRRGKDGRTSGGEEGRREARGRTNKGRRGGSKRGAGAQWRPRPPKRKPVKPLTEAMVEGREPMRTFSDLQQFFDKKKKGEVDLQKKEKGER